MKYKEGTKLKYIGGTHEFNILEGDIVEVLDYEYRDKTYSLSNLSLKDGWCASFIENPKKFVLATITNWRGEFNG